MTLNYHDVMILYFYTHRELVMKVMILISNLPLQREKCVGPEHLERPANLNLPLL